MEYLPPPTSVQVVSTWPEPSIDTLTVPQPATTKSAHWLIDAKAALYRVRQKRSPRAISQKRYGGCCFFAAPFIDLLIFQGFILANNSVFFNIFKIAIKLSSFSVLFFFKVIHNRVRQYIRILKAITQRLECSRVGSSSEASTIPSISLKYLS